MGMPAAQLGSQAPKSAPKNASPPGGAPSIAAFPLPIEKTGRPATKHPNVVVKGGGNGLSNAPGPIVDPTNWFDESKTTQSARHHDTVQPAPLPPAPLPPPPAVMTPAPALPGLGPLLDDSGSEDEDVIDGAPARSTDNMAGGDIPGAEMATQVLDQSASYMAYDGEETSPS
jgi:hypothetical protein